MKQFIIYKIENLINHKIYIGQTTINLKYRWFQHKRAANLGFDFKLYKAMRKYGINNFKIDLLQQVENIDDLNILEQEMIKKYNSIENGYNCTTGGKNYHRSKEFNMKMSIIKKGQFHTNEMKQKLSEKMSSKNHPNYGKHLSEETCKKISLSHIGKKHTLESRTKISNSQKGRIPWNKGIKLTEKQKEKNTTKFKLGTKMRLGMHHSDESKLKMSISRINYLNSKRGVINES
jgi:group I intron endonuclease